MELWTNPSMIAKWFQHRPTLPARKVCSNKDMNSKDIGTELRDIYEVDQAERIVGHENIDFDKMHENDKPRLARAKEIYDLVKEGSVDLTGEELYFLAILFQHSPAIEDYVTAKEIGQLSAEKGYELGKWMSAAAEDRYLLNTGKKQIWGTQFTKDSGEWEIMPIQSDEESGITDDMRKMKNVPIRADQMKVFLARTDI